MKQHDHKMKVISTQSSSTNEDIKEEAEASEKTALSTRKTTKPTEIIPEPMRQLWIYSLRPAKMPPPPCLGQFLQRPRPLC